MVGGYLVGLGGCRCLQRSLLLADGRPQAVGRRLGVDPVAVAACLLLQRRADVAAGLAVDLQLGAGLGCCLGSGVQETGRY